jgi:alkaline phosphatase
MGTKATFILLAALLPAFAGAGETVVLSPPVGTVVAVGQRFDVRAALPGREDVRWEVRLGERSLPGGEAPAGVFLQRGVVLAHAGRHLLRAVARGGGGEVVAAAETTVEARPWRGAGGAKNVILLIADGMGHAHRTAARLALHGLEGGKPRGWLAMDTLPVEGVLTTSSLSGLVTDSAAAGHALATGTKTANGMLGLWPDDTPERDDDNPRVEQLPGLLWRERRMVTGIVSNADLTDATPAAFVAAVADRGAAAEVVRGFRHAAAEGYLQVLLGGGARHLLPGGEPPAEFSAAGYRLVRTAAQLEAARREGATHLLGLFHSGHMNTEFDRQRRGDPEVVKDFPDQPSLEAMTRAALAALARHPHGFFLMVEGALVDKQAHNGDQERVVWEVLAFDRAVAAALEFARATNTDGIAGNDTLVVVTADHETGGAVLPGVVLAGCRGSRDCLLTYDAGGFPSAGDADGDGFPDVVEGERKVVLHFAAGPDRYEDWLAQPRPVPLALGRAGRDRLVIPNPERDGGTGAWLGGITPVTVPPQGYAPTQTVHTAVDVPLSAYGPGAEALGGVRDNTEVFFALLRAVGAGSATVRR